MTKNKHTKHEKIEIESGKTTVLVKRIFRDYLLQHKRLLILALLCMFVSAAMTGGLAALMEPMIDDVFQAKNKSMLVPVALAIFFTFLLRGFATYGHTVFMNEVGQSIVAKIQSDLFGHLLNMDLSYFHSNTSGQLISRVVNDVALMRQAVAECFTGMGKSILTLVILAGVMFYQDWQLAIGAFFVFPLSAIMVAKVGKKLRRVSHDTQESLADLSSLLSQAFQGVRQVKAYGMEAFEQARVDGFVNQLFKLVHKAVRVSALTTPLTEVLTGLAMVTVVLYGGYQVITGQNSTGSLFSFITAFMLAYEPMKKLARLNNTLQIGLAAADRVFNTMDRESNVQDVKNAKDLTLDSAEIIFDNISFIYDDGTKALDDLSLTVKAGQTVALVGASGAGKSTLLNLVPRFYDTRSGVITVDGQDIKNVTQKSLREAMALVSQDISMFNDSVRDNIAYGLSDVDQKTVEAAAHKAAAHDFILELPEGYDTIVGENGVKLSGGQKQRIAIARAMLRNAPILLLDEATSALDSESERLIQEALDTLRAGKTTLVIAHRLSTIQNADVICVMESGRIVEQGSHDELLSRKGLYYKFHTLQQKNT